MKLFKAIGQSGRTGLQDQGRFDLVHVSVLHCRGSVKARPRYHPLWPELLAAPGADDQIRLSCDHLINGHHSILGGGMTCTIGEDIDTAPDSDELRDPPNPRDQRIVPLLEEYPWSFR
jgi:hypothetical protein